MSNHTEHRDYPDGDWLRHLLNRYEEIDARLGSDVGRGWQPIVGEAALALDEVVPGWWADQIKEKFGTLTMYIGLPHGVDRTAEYLADAITAFAARKSSSTCEWCGECGRLDSSDFWMLTLCVQCRQIRREGRNLKREEIERRYMEQDA